MTVSRIKRLTPAMDLRYGTFVASAITNVSEKSNHVDWHAPTSLNMLAAPLPWAITADSTPVSAADVSFGFEELCSIV